MEKQSRECLRLELPLFMLLVAVFSSTGKTLHEAFIALRHSSRLRQVFRCFSNIADKYVKFTATASSHVAALARLASSTTCNDLKNFIKGFLAISMSRGNTLDYVEFMVKEQLSRIGDEARLRINIIASIMEAILLVSSIVVFVLTIASTGASIVKNTILVLAIVTPLIAYYLRLRMVEVYVSRQPSWAKYLTIVMLVLLLASQCCVLGRSASLLLISMASAISLALFAQNINSLRMIKSVLPYYRLLLDSLQMGVETINAYSMVETGFKPRLAGRARARSSIVKFVEYIVGEVSKAGPSAARIAKIALELLLDLTSKISMAVKYALLYEILTLVVFLTLSLAYRAAQSIILGVAGIVGPVLLPSLGDVTSLLALSSSIAAYSITITVWGNGGSIAVPLILLASSLLGTIYPQP